MKTIKYVLGCSILLFAFTGCTKNPVKCFGGSWIQELSSELTDWTAAAQEYSDNPTSANCNSYKSSVNNYLDAIDKIKDCVPTASLGDLNGSIDEAKQELNEIDCQQ
jgi:hypothetical protein